MTDLLDDQIREALRSIMDLAQVPVGSDPPEAVHWFSPRRGSPVTVAACLLLLAGVGGLALVARSGEPPTSSTSPSARSQDVEVQVIEPDSGPAGEPAPCDGEGNAAVPDVVGLSIDVAMDRLLRFGVDAAFDTRPAGDDRSWYVVTGQTPSAGAFVACGSFISLDVVLEDLSLRTPAETSMETILTCSDGGSVVTVPLVAGTSYEAAANALSALGLEPVGGFESSPRGTASESDLVLSQRTPPGESVSCGATIQLVVPFEPGPFYVTESGDSYVSIAAEQGLSTDELLSFNGTSARELEVQGAAVGAPLDAGLGVRLTSPPSQR